MNNKCYLYKAAVSGYNEVNKSAFEYFSEGSIMTIGQTIKKLRRERDITQEQLAEYIGISAQAVSQWETDRTAPDISQLPLLAHIFDVSTDEILGVDIEKSNQRIKEICDEAHAFYAKGDFGKAAEVYEKGLKQFPRSFKIMENLAENLGLTGRDSEAVELCRKILAECTDNKLRDCATQTMIYAYRDLGDKQSALKTARGLSSAWFSRQDFLLHLLKGSNDSERDEAEKNLHDYVDFCVNRLTRCLEALSQQCFGYSDDERIKLLESAIAITEAVYTDGDYCFSAQFVELFYERLRDIYAEKKDVENTLKCLEKEVEFCVHFNNYDTKGVHTSPAVRGYKVDKWIPIPGGNHCKLTAVEIRKCELLEFVREEPRFKAALELLDKYSD